LGLFYIIPKTHLVEQGYIGTRLVDGKPQILPPGWHCNVNISTQDWKVVKLTEKVINVATLWIITVDTDKFGLAWEQANPLILGPGIHFRNSPFFKFDKMVDQSEPVISHGPSHRIIVGQGSRAISWLGDRPLLLKPGIHTINSPIFKFGRTAPNTDQVVDLNPFKIVTVRDGQVGVAYRRGVLDVLNPGEHSLNAETNDCFLDFLPVTKQVRQLKPIDILTSSGFFLRTRGSIAFHISNPKKTLVCVGNSQDQVKTDTHKHHISITDILFDTIMMRADTTFASILTGSEFLSSIAMGMAKGVPKGNTPQTPQEEDDSQSDRKKKKEIKMHKINSGVTSDEHSRQELTRLLSEQFKGSLTKEFIQDWGVTLDDMVVLEVEILDRDVKAALANGVKLNVEATTDRRNAEAKAETARIQAQGERDAIRIRAEGKASEILMIAQAEKDAGLLLESSPAAVQIRLGQISATAFNKGSLVIAPDGGTASLMALLGASSRVPAPNK